MFSRELVERKEIWLKKEKGNGLIAISNAGAVLTEADFYLDMSQILNSDIMIRIPKPRNICTC